MVQVVGQDSPILEAICAAVSPAEPSRAAPAAQAEAGRFVVEPSGLDRGALFAQLLRDKPDAVVIVDGLSRLGRGPAQSELIDLAKVVGAATGASVRKLILVTSRDKDDPALVKLRRSGVPYVVLQVGAVAQLSADVDRDSLASRKVLVPEEVLGAAQNAVSADEIGMVVKETIERTGIMGRTIPVGPSSERTALVATLEQAGARPVLDESWRSRVTRWLGRPVAHITDDGTVAISTRRARPRAAERRAAEIAHAF